MMLLQKEIEAKMLAAIRSALEGVEVEVHGAWEEAFAGLTRWSESPDAASFVSVALTSPSRNAPSDPTASMTANVSVFVRTECDPRGEALCTIAEHLQALFEGWIGSSYQADFTALDIPEFSVDGVAIAEGTSPVVNNAVVSVTYTLSLSGSYT